MRKLFAAALAASLSVSAASHGWGQEAASPAGAQPSRLQLTPSGVAGGVHASPNQRLADAVAEKLNHSPLLKNFRVNITVQDGEVDLVGTVLTQSQRAAALELAQSVPGVARVRDRLQVALAGEVQPAQATLPPGGLPKAVSDPKAPMPPGSLLPMPPLPLPGAGAPGYGAPGYGGPAGPAMGPGGMLEPLPLGGGTPPGFPAATQPPPMPPNAWPTYAPYNNYSRVAYPTLYPYESFPFIGPFYPFPKVPLGWRSVTLSWEDGHWWLGRNATGHDWWRVRYW